MNAQPYSNESIAAVLANLDFGSTIAENDTLLEDSRVETSAFTDILNDRVDLVPGTKGSGKSALYRIFVEFLRDYLLQQRRAVVAHGVDREGDNVFHVYKDQFSQLEEDDFVNFWSIYIVSLIHEQFIKNPLFATHLSECKGEIDQFKRTSSLAGIPEIRSKQSLRQVLAWVLAALKVINPKVKYTPPEDTGQFELSLFDSKDEGSAKPTEPVRDLPKYMSQLREDAEALFKKANLKIWFMIDKLDEIFPRRSTTERRALRSLLRTMRVFASETMRIKVFLRDDMLSEIVSGKEGFVALTHVTARQADTLRWSEDQIMTMTVNRLFSSTALRQLLGVNKEQLDASLEYRRAAFYKVFPSQVHKGTSQSSTLRWIYNHTADANGVVTPRDVIELLTRARQYQYDQLRDNPSGSSDHIISSQSIQYGLGELSKLKRNTYLKAEFPHLWTSIEKFIDGKSEYTEKGLRSLLGKDWSSSVGDLQSVGLLSRSKARAGYIYTIPHLYRKGLQITQGRAD